MHHGTGNFQLVMHEHCCTVRSGSLIVSCSPRRFCTLRQIRTVKNKISGNRVGIQSEKDMRREGKSSTWACDLPPPGDSVCQSSLHLLHITVKAELEPVFIQSPGSRSERQTIAFVPEPRVCPLSVVHSRRTSPISKINSGRSLLNPNNPL